MGDSKLEQSFSIPLKGRRKKIFKMRLKAKTKDSFSIQQKTNKILFYLIFSQCVTKSEYKSLLNFVALNGDIEKSNILMRTLFAMINQPIDQNTREQIINTANKTKLIPTGDTQL